MAPILVTRFDRGELLDIDHSFRREAESLWQLARASWGRRLLGRRPRSRIAGGTEVTGTADYAAGDDFRYVDWYRAARLDELVTRQFAGEEDTTVHLLLDTSASMALGDPTKLDVARRIAAHLAYIANKNLDRVTVATFADRLLSQSPAYCGGRHLPQLLQQIAAIEPTDQATNLARTAEEFLRNNPRPGLVVLLTDLCDTAGYQRGVGHLARAGHEVFIIQPFTRDEIAPQTGRVTLTEAETGNQRSVTLSPRDVDNYRQILADHCQAIRRECSRQRMGLLQVANDEPVRETMERLIRTSALPRIVNQPIPAAAGLR